MSGLSFSWKLITSTVFGLIAGFTLYALYNDALQRQAVEDNVAARIEAAGDGTAAQIAEWLMARIKLATAAAQAIQGKTDDQAAITHLLSLPIYQETFDLSYFGFSDRPAFIRSPNIPMPENYDFRIRPLFMTTKAVGATTLLEPYVDAATGELVASIGLPIQQGGQLRGVFGVDLSLKNLVQAIFQQKVGGLGYAFFVNASGTILASPKEGQQGKTLSQVFHANLPGIQDGATVSVVADGEAKLLYFRKIRGIPSESWYVALAIDQTLAHAPLDEARFSALLGLAAVAVLVILLMVAQIRILLRPLRQLTFAMQEIADGEGDLTRRLNYDAEDEFGQLSKSFNRFVGRINDAMIAVDRSVKRLNGISSQVLENSRASLGNSEEQVERVLVIAASVEELGATAQEIAASAACGASETTKVKGMHEHGQRLSSSSMDVIAALSSKVIDARQSMENLSSKTEHIGAILDVIKNISDQTNLLALNAAIEAARAGDAGRGFAVVADEVRGLAHRTQLSTLEVNDMITQLQAGTRLAVKDMLECQAQGQDSEALIREASQSIAQLAEGMSEIDRMTLSVAAATEQQSSVVGSLSAELNDISRRNSEAVEGLNSTIESCAALDQEALVLNNMLQSFKIH